MLSGLMTSYCIDVIEERRKLPIVNVSILLKYLHQRIPWVIKAYFCPRAPGEAVPS